MDLVVRSVVEVRKHPRNAIVSCRAVGTLAGSFHAHATTTTIRIHLI
jgi:hypothetical protein